MRDEKDSPAARYSRFVAELRQTVFEGPGQVDPALRQSAATGEALSGPWSSYTDKVRNEPWTVADSDIDDLRSAGHSEDEIFEMTVAAALGASLRMLDAGLKALRDASQSAG
jgi:hypothetical protein